MQGFKSPGSAQRFLSTHAATYNTLNVQKRAISFQPEHTEPFVHRLWTCGARQSRSLENVRDAEFSRSFFDSVTDSAVKQPKRECRNEKSIEAFPSAWLRRNVFHPFAFTIAPFLAE